MRFLPDLARLLVAWPVYAAYHAISLANTYQGAPRQGGNVSKLPADRRRDVWGLGAYVGACPMAVYARRVRRRPAHQRRGAPWVLAAN